MSKTLEWLYSLEPKRQKRPPTPERKTFLVKYFTHPDRNDLRYFFHVLDVLDMYGEWNQASLNMAQYLVSKYYAIDTSIQVSGEKSAHFFVQLACSLHFPSFFHYITLLSKQKKCQKDEIDTYFNVALLLMLSNDYYKYSNYHLIQSAYLLFEKKEGSASLKKIFSDILLHSEGQLPTEMLLVCRKVQQNFITLTDQPLEEVKYIDFFCPERIYSFGQKDFPFLLNSSQLGVGSLGTVYQDKNGNAVKRCKWEYKSDVMSETSLLRFLDHPNLIQHHCVSIHSITLLRFHIEMPLFPFNLSDEFNDVYGKTHLIKPIIAQVLKALMYLHERSILHRDVKLGNILFDEKYHAVLCDFSLAKFSPIEEKAERLVQTYEYRAPEVYTNKILTNKIDIWSVGSVLMHLYPSARFIQHLKRINSIDEKEWGMMILEKEDWWEPLVEIQDILLKDLIRQMIKRNPAERYSAQECLQHEYFSKN